MFGCQGKLWLGLTFNGMSWVALGINKSYYDVGFSQILQLTWKSLRSVGWGTWLDIWVCWVICDFIFRQRKQIHLAAGILKLLNNIQYCETAPTVASFCCHSGQLQFSIFALSSCLQTRIIVKGKRVLLYHKSWLERKNSQVHLCWTASQRRKIAFAGAKYPW